MAVSTRDLERYIDRVAATARSPSAGLFGPDSMVWQVNREAISILAGGRVLLLQAAHPFVAHGVDQHSQNQTDPLGRFRRTYYNIASVVFGALEDAVTSARRVHRLHATITGKITENVAKYQPGDAYEANLEPALMWVHATLWEGAVLAYETAVRPLSLEEKNKFYEEGKLFAYLFGITDDTLPPDWTQFSEYCEKMYASNELGVGRAALDIKRWALVAPMRLLIPAMWVYKIVTAGLLPPRFREEFGFRWNALDRTVYKATIGTIRTAYPLLPSFVRHIPPYLDAKRRILGLPGRHWWGQWQEAGFMKMMAGRASQTSPQPLALKGEGQER